MLGAAVRLRVSPRARRLALRVDAAAREVELVLPKGVSRARGLAFLAERRGWVLSRLEALPERVPFVEGAVVPLLGAPHRIVVETDPAAPPVAIRDREIRVRGAPAHLARRVRDHLVQMARAEFGRRARPLALSIGRQVARIGVRDGKSRWGSCSSKGNLSFSWRLVLAPESVLAYVVAHEVAHLAEMNHGRRFWQIVERLSPGSAAARTWLRRNRSRLLCYG